MLKENFIGFIEKSITSNWKISALADYKLRVNDLVKNGDNLCL